MDGMGNANDGRIEFYEDEKIIVFIRKNTHRFGKNKRRYLNKLSIFLVGPLINIIITNLVFVLFWNKCLNRWIFFFKYRF